MNIPSSHRLAILFYLAACTLVFGALDGCTDTMPDSNQSHRIPSLIGGGAGAAPVSDDNETHEASSNDSTAEKGPTEAVIETLGPGEVFGDFFFIADNGEYTVATITDKDGRTFVSVDGKRYGHECDEIWSPTIAPNGQSVAYAARSEGKNYVVKDSDVIGQKYDSVSHLSYSPDGKTFVFVASLGKESFLVKNGERVDRDFGVIVDYIFANDNSMICVETDQGRSFLIRNGAKVSEEYDFILTVQVSPDGKSLAFVGCRNKEFTVIRDEKQIGAVYDGVSSFLQYAPTSESLAFVARIGGETFLMLNGDKYSEACEEIGDFAFLPDGKSLVYSRSTRDKDAPNKAEEPLPGPALPPLELAKWSLMKDNREEGKPYDCISDLVVSSDGNNIAFVAQEKGKFYVIVNGKAVGEGHDAISNLVVSPDNARLIFSTLDEKDRKIRCITIPLPQPESPAAPEH